VSHTADTLGYVLMQKGLIERALPFLEEAGKSRQNPGATFRYALALNKMVGANEKEPIGSLSSAMNRNYSPSHELYLLRDFFSQPGKFMTAFAEHQPKPETPPPGGWCQVSIPRQSRGL
jgi:hypothetical protein